MRATREPQRNYERWVAVAVGILFIGSAMAIVYVFAGDYTFGVIATALAVGGLGVDALFSAACNRRSLLSRIGPLP
jgi:hypothetical protein